MLRENVGWAWERGRAALRTWDGPGNEANVKGSVVRIFLALYRFNIYKPLALPYHIIPGMQSLALFTPFVPHGN